VLPSGAADLQADEVAPSLVRRHPQGQFTARRMSEEKHARAVRLVHEQHVERCEGEVDLKRGIGDLLGVPLGGSVPGPVEGDGGAAEGRGRAQQRQLRTVRAVEVRGGGAATMQGEQHGSGPFHRADQRRQRNAVGVDDVCVRVRRGVGVVVGHVAVLGGKVPGPGGRARPAVAPGPLSHGVRKMSRPLRSANAFVNAGSSGPVTPVAALADHALSRASSERIASETVDHGGNRRQVAARVSVGLVRIVGEEGASAKSPLLGRGVMGRVRWDPDLALGAKSLERYPCPVTQSIR
jgi:hypothetical protein